MVSLTERERKLAGITPDQVLIVRTAEDAKRLKRLHAIRAELYDRDSR